MIHVLAAAQSSQAGIITSVASISTAVILMITAAIGLYQVMHLRKQATDTTARLDVIHDLVNHTLTESIESDLAGTKASLATMEQLVGAQQDRGIEQHPETIAAMEGARVKIERLTRQLADRMTVAERIVEDGKQRAATQT